MKLKLAKENLEHNCKASLDYSEYALKYAKEAREKYLEDDSGSDKESVDDKSECEFNADCDGGFVCIDGDCKEKDSSGGDGSGDKSGSDDNNSDDGNHS